MTIFSTGMVELNDISTLIIPVAELMLTDERTIENDEDDTLTPLIYTITLNALL